MAQMRLADFFPQSYLGENTRSKAAKSHWLSFNDYAIMHGFTAQQQLDRFQLTLAGKAKLWIDGKHFNTPNDLKTAFEAHFSGLHSR